MRVVISGAEMPLPLEADRASRGAAGLPSGALWLALLAYTEVVRTGSDRRKSNEGTASSAGEGSPGRRALSRGKDAGILGACDFEEARSGADAPSRGLLDRGSRPLLAR